MFSVFFHWPVIGSGKHQRKGSGKGWAGGGGQHFDSSLPLEQLCSVYRAIALKLTSLESVLLYSSKFANHKRRTSLL